MAVALLAALAALGPPAPATLPARQPVPQAVVRIGTSVAGRAIRARVVGEREAPHRVLVVGCIHGSERAGEAVTARLSGARPPRRVALWLVARVNPDGCRAGTRGNRHGVDLNRNAPWRWRPLDPPGGTYYAGPAALSEPESQAIARLVRRVHPAITVWYHQHAALVDPNGGEADRRVQRRYAERVDLPLRDFHAGLTGIWTGWQEATRPRSTSFVVELPPGALDRRAAARHAAAVLDAARQLARARA